MYTFYYTISGKPVFENYSATPRLVSEFLWKIMVTFALLLYIIRSYAPICNAAALRCWNGWHFIIIISSSTFYKYTPKKIRGSCHFVEEYGFFAQRPMKKFLFFTKFLHFLVRETAAHVFNTMENLHF